MEVREEGKTEKADIYVTDVFTENKGIRHTFRSGRAEDVRRMEQ